MTVRKKYESYCKFDDEILSEFKGAARSPSTKNEPGLLLEKYVKSVVADTVTEGSVKAITVGNIIQVDQELIANSDVIVCHIKAVPSVAAENLMTLACSRAKDVAVMFLMPDRNAQVWCLRELSKYMDENVHEVQIEQLFFEKNKLAKFARAQIVENLSFGLLVGKFVIIKPPLNIAHGEINTCLKNVMSHVIMPGSKVMFLSEKNSPIYDLHSVDDLNLCDFSYFGESGAISRLHKRWSRNKVLKCGEEISEGEGVEDCHGDEDISKGVEDRQGEEAISKDENSQDSQAENGDKVADSGVMMQSDEDDATHTE